MSSNLMNKQDHNFNLCPQQQWEAHECISSKYCCDIWKHISEHLRKKEKFFFIVIDKYCITVYSNILHMLFWHAQGCSERKSEWFYVTGKIISKLKHTILNSLDTSWVFSCVWCFYGHDIFFYWAQEGWWAHITALCTGEHLTI